jgi:hypothetical protein
MILPLSHERMTVQRLPLFGEYGFVATRQEWADLFGSLFLHDTRIRFFYFLWWLGLRWEMLEANPNVVLTPREVLSIGPALADLYLQDYKEHLALEVLTSVAPLAESSPDWKDYLQQKIAAVRRTGAPAAPQS